MRGCCLICLLKYGLRSLAGHSHFLFIGRPVFFSSVGWYFIPASWCLDLSVQLPDLVDLFIWLLIERKLLVFEVNWKYRDFFCGQIACILRLLFRNIVPAVLLFLFYEISSRIVVWILLICCVFVVWYSSAFQRVLQLDWQNHFFLYLC
jgi:hypothetical protein